MKAVLANGKLWAVGWEHLHAVFDEGVVAEADALEHEGLLFVNDPTKAGECEMEPEDAVESIFNEDEHEEPCGDEPEEAVAGEVPELAAAEAVAGEVPEPAAAEAVAGEVPELPAAQVSAQAVAQEEVPPEVVKLRRLVALSLVYGRPSQKLIDKAQALLGSGAASSSA